jgi:hypothetical protein
VRVLDHWPDAKRPHLRTLLVVVDADDDLEIGGRLEASRIGIHGRIAAMRPVNSPQVGIRPGESVVGVDVEVDAA